MTSERALAMLGLGAVLFGYPLMAVASQGGFVGGVPLLFGYLFAAWALFVGALAWLAERAPATEAPTNASPARGERRERNDAGNASAAPPGDT